MDGFGDETDMWAQGTAWKEEEEKQQEKDSSTKLIFLNAVVDKELYTYSTSYRTLISTALFSQDHNLAAVPTMHLLITPCMCISCVSLVSSRTTTSRSQAMTQVLDEIARLDDARK